jgi:hypothetical protein
MSKIKKFVIPELTVISNVIHGPQVLHDVTGTNSSWSGLTVTQPGAFDTVWGNWIVPAATVPPGGADDYYSSLWVGLNDNASLFQAGTEQDSTLSTGIFGGLSSSYYAWYEWYPGPTVQVGQFPVTAGQGVIVTVGPQQYPGDPSASSGPGLVSMFNFSTGTAITPIVVQIPTVDFNGNTITPPILGLPSVQVDWILERPTLVSNGTQSLSALADYGEAVIISGGALVKDVSAVTVGSNDQGTLLNMLADDGVTVLSTVAEIPELQFTFTGGPTA